MTITFCLGSVPRIGKYWKSPEEEKLGKYGACLVCVPSLKGHILSSFCMLWLLATALKFYNYYYYQKGYSDIKLFCHDWSWHMLIQI